MPKGKIQTNTDHYLYKLKVPGVGPKSFNIEIDHQNLMVYQQMQFDEELEIPHLVRRITIPAEVNYRNITAEFQNGLISIKLPFNELADDYHKNIDLGLN